MLGISSILSASAPIILALLYMQENLVFAGGTDDNIIDALNFTHFNLDFDAGVEDPSTLQIILDDGYEGETHTVTTKDGYILEIFRIPGSNHTSNTVNKPVVFLMPGITCSSSAWVLTIPEKSLAILLADAGYDVWLGNARGTTYGRKHTSLTVHDKEFWLFSWHEIGVLDLPAMIDYILEKTNQKKLFYIGHSQGTTNFFVLASEQPEYQDKIEAMFALAPVAYLANMKSPILRILGDASTELKLLTQLIGEYELEPTPDFIKQILNIACDAHAITEPICADVLFQLGGFSPYQTNRTLLPTIYQHFPVGVSVKQAVHYAQVFKSGKFRQYDYGIPGNLKHYGKAVPPSYDLGSIKVPVYLDYSTNDWLGDPTDVHHLHKDLGNSIEIQVADDTFNHFDFLWGKDSRELVYNKVIDLISKYKIN